MKRSPDVIVEMPFLEQKMSQTINSSKRSNAQQVAHSIQQWPVVGIWFYRLELKFFLAYLCPLYTLSEMGLYNTCFFGSCCDGGLSSKYAQKEAGRKSSFDDDTHLIWPYLKM